MTHTLLRRSRRPGLAMLALEPRWMFDAAAAADVADAVADTSAAAHLTQVQAADAAQNSGRLEVVFIDGSVPDWQQLVATIHAGVEVQVIASGSDGLAQIAAWAQTHSGYDAIAIVSHGGIGWFSVGTTTINTAALSDSTTRTELTELAQALKSDGALLLYGCDVAQGDSGYGFISSLSSLIGHSVSASTDTTGGTGLSGDWDLEASTGYSYSFTLVNGADWLHILAAPAFSETFTSETSLSSNWTYISNWSGTSLSSTYGAILTNGGTVQTADLIYNQAFDSSAGIDLRFTYYMGPNTTLGADGLSFFLLDGSTNLVTSFTTGAPGPGLGYSSNVNIAGISGGVLGVGFDLWGNYSGDAAGTGSPGPTDSRPGNTYRGDIVLRGSGNAATSTGGYEYLTAVQPDSSGNPQSPGSGNTTYIAGEHAVEIILAVNSNTGHYELTVKLDNKTQISAYDLTANGITVPSTLMFGFGASTGGNVNTQSIKSVSVFTAAAASDPVWPTFTSTTPTTINVDSGTAFDLSSYLQASDTDSGQTMTWSQASGPSHGTLTITGATASSGSTSITPGGTLTYTATDGYVGTDTFTIQVSDGTTWSTKTITVSVDKTPSFVAASSTLTVDSDSAATSLSSLLAVSDTDSGQTLTWTQVSGASHGTVTLTGATASSGGTSITSGGTLTYQPTAGYSGTDTFTIAVSDGIRTVQRTITVVVDLAPSFVGSTTTLTVDSNSGPVSIASLVQVSDTNSGQTLTWSQASAPSHGTLSITGATATSGGTTISPGGTLTYQPAAGFVGTDTFTIEVSDGFRTVQRTITVTVDKAPSFVGTTTTLDVESNSGAVSLASLLQISDTDSGQTLTWTQASAPSHGTLSIAGATAASGGTAISLGGTLTYQPAADFFGTDTFTIEVSDGLRTVQRTITVTVDKTPSFATTAATLSITNTSGAISLASLLAVSDTDSGQTLTWTQSSAPSSGVLTIIGATSASGGTANVAGGTLTYQPNAGFVGTDTFVIQVSDGIRTILQTVTIFVTNPPSVVQSPTPPTNDTVTVPSNTASTTSSGTGTGSDTGTTTSTTPTTTSTTTPTSTSTTTSTDGLNTALASLTQPGTSNTTSSSGDAGTGSTGTGTTTSTSPSTTTGLGGGDVLSPAITGTTGTDSGTNSSTASDSSTTTGTTAEAAVTLATALATGSLPTASTGSDAANDAYSRALANALAEGRTLSQATTLAQQAAAAQASADAAAGDPNAALASGDVAALLGSDAGSALYQQALGAALARGVSLAEAQAQASQAVAGLAGSGDPAVALAEALASGKASGLTAGLSDSAAAAFEKTLSGALARGASVADALAQARGAAGQADSLDNAARNSPLGDLASGGKRTGSEGAAYDRALSAALAAGLPLDVAQARARDAARAMAAATGKLTEADALASGKRVDEILGPRSKDPVFMAAFNRALAAGKDVRVAMAEADRAARDAKAANENAYDRLPEALATGKQVDPAKAPHSGDLQGPAKTLFDRVLGRTLQNGTPLPEAIKRANAAVAEFQATESAAANIPQPPIAPSRAQASR